MKKLYLSIFFSVLLFGTVKLMAQTVRYVKPNGTGNGSSWAQASGDLQTMIDSSEDGDSVWVAAGTYKPTKAPWAKTVEVATTNSPAKPTTERDYAFILKSGIGVFGGFAGNEVNFDQRNFETNITILSGDLNNDGTASDGDCYHVVISLNNSDNATLDGFTIQHGYANGTLSIGTDSEQSTVSLAQNTGGGICTRGSRTGIRYANLILRENYASTTGGAVFQRTGGTAKEFRFYNVKFLNNTALGNAGALYVYPGIETPQLFLEKCVFENNTGNNGGAICITTNAVGGSSVNIIDCDFKNNKAASTASGGHIYQGNRTLKISDSKFYDGTASLGGAIYTPPGNTTVMSVSNSHFEGNKSTSSSTTASASGGGAIVFSSTTATTKSTVQNCTFVSNQSANVGGGIHLASNSPAILNCKFIKNTAAFNGGAISMYSSSATSNCKPEILNSLFYANQSKGTGTAHAGGAIYVAANGCPTVVNSTFYANASANNAGAFYLANNDINIAASGNNVTETKIYNTIFYANTATKNFADIQTIGTNSLVVKNTLTQVFGVNGVDENIVATDPNFASVDENSPDFLRLGPSSRAVNVGETAYLSVAITQDLEGKNRVIYDFLDLGCYEYDGPLNDFHAFYIKENSPIGTAVGTPTTTITGTIMWSILSGNTDNVFKMDGGTGEITVNNNVPLDYETKKAFRLRVRAYNGTTEDIFMVFAIVENVMEDPVTPIILNRSNNGEVRSYWPRLEGIAEPLATVYIYMDNVKTPYNTQTNEKGEWNIKFPDPISSGYHSFYVITTNNLGTSNASNSVDANFILYPGVISPNNILTPNGDGKNDVWIVEFLPVMYPKNDVIVYDKTGKIVFKKNNYQNDWDGTYKGTPLNTGTYYYLINIGIEEKPIKGTLTILRGR